jgi:hypothetical protein
MIVSSQPGKNILTQVNLPGKRSDIVILIFMKKFKISQWTKGWRWMNAEYETKRQMQDINSCIFS